MPNLVFLFSFYCFRVRTSHPGAVIALCDNPLDANKVINRLIDQEWREILLVRKAHLTSEGSSLIDSPYLLTRSLSSSAPAQLLIAFECGLLVLWDLKAKCAEIRWQAAEVKSLAWHYEGKYFVSSHTDGSICSWPTKPLPKPQSQVCPHGKWSSLNMQSVYD